MDFIMLLNKILRLPKDKGVDLLSEYRKSHTFTVFSEQQRVLDLLTFKTTELSRIKREFIMETVVAIKLMSQKRNRLSIEAFDAIKNYPMLLWIEGIGALKPQEIISLLANYHEYFSSILIETCIINLPDNEQVEMIKKYYKEIDSQKETYHNFYYSVSKSAQDTLDLLYPNMIQDKLLLKIKDVDEDDLLELIQNNLEELSKYNEDRIIEEILLKVSNPNIMANCLSLLKDIIFKCSDAKFELLLIRYSYLRNNWDDEDELENFDDLVLYETFKEKFHDLGITRTLKMFNNIKFYGINKFTEHVILDFIDIAYDGINIGDYLNEETIVSIMKNYATKCRQEEYTLDEFANLVDKCRKDKNKLIKDNFIKAITACGELLKNHVITDKHPLFTELRELFNQDLFERLACDGTVTTPVDFKGIFYRLAKGTLPFEDVYLTKTYRGIIYLSKCGNNTKNADYITNYLTDEQILKLDISPMFNWMKKITRTNTKADYDFLLIRMCLQLLLFFGVKKGEYLINANIAGNRMESLFDGLNYKDILIDESGKPIINEEINNYLFGYGKMNVSTNVINRLIRGEIMEFEKYFPEFVNNFDNIKKKCNGILSIKRIIRELDNFSLPFELMPDEKNYKDALKELNTTDEDILKEAISLLNDARKRRFSTIPKVKGKVGEFTYEMLDLDDPMNIAVGYLSHCCFKIKGFSYSSLIQAMQSHYGRIFVVYYKDTFLAQSWVWRNGDVVCFDSVESGSPVHGAYKDDIHLVDVYTQAAEEILSKSQNYEDPDQAIKLVTVGRSDYIFAKNLPEIEGDVPRPLEDDLYIADSRYPKVLAGNPAMKNNYGYVGAQYFDTRFKAISINNVANADINELDKALVNIDALRYQIKGLIDPLDTNKCQNIYCGDGWYIIIYKDKTVEHGILYDDKYTIDEYNSFLNKLDIVNEQQNGYSKSLKPNFR